MKLSKSKIIADFRKDVNCSQSVLAYFADSLEISNDLALGIASGFGAGMGRMQKTCGAVTGAYMVIGLMAGKQFRENTERKEAAYKMIADFTRKFENEHGSSVCSELTGCDFTSEEGKLKFINEGTEERVCEKCVLSSIKILEELNRS